MKFLTFNSDGTLQARWDDAVNLNIPLDAVAVSDALFDSIATEQAGCWKLVDGVVVNDHSDIQSLIDALESKTHMNRFVREAMLLTSIKEAAALGYTEAQLYAANVGYQKVKDLDTQITLLRSQMGAS